MIEMSSRLCVCSGIPGTDDDIRDRTMTFGRNEIPAPQQKCFLRLVWEALHDVILIILIIAACVSISVSFYNYYTQPDSNDQHDGTSFFNQFNSVLKSIKDH